MARTDDGGHFPAPSEDELSFEELTDEQLGQLALWFLEGGANSLRGLWLVELISRLRNEGWTLGDVMDLSNVRSLRELEADKLRAGPWRFVIAWLEVAQGRGVAAATRLMVEASRECGTGWVEEAVIPALFKE